MRILWFTNTPSLYKKNIKGYNGGGWIESLEKIISEDDNVVLGISFYHSDDCFKSKQGNTTYYPISLYDSFLKKLRHNLFYSSYDKIELDTYLEVINDFKPDVIQIFGSEASFGLVSAYTNIPVVIHLQGILNPYLNAFYAPGSSKSDLILKYFFEPVKLINILRGISFFSHNTSRETIILENCKYFMGRTEWDKNITNLYAPDSTYFYCSEVLRDIFYTSTPWQLKNRDKLILVSTISKTTYKGFDLILKTAKLLKEHTCINFDWNIFGVLDYKEWERKLGIKCEEVNVNLNGIVDSVTIVKNLQESDLFIHPSYIDNSPNSICEAQLLGIPIVSTNVGGISSLIENNKNGFLVPANDPYTLATRIIELKNNSYKAAEIGKYARETALLRHDKDVIKKNLISIYNELTTAGTSN